VCSALQLVNFWQDLSVDLPRGRRYVPRADAAAHGVDLDALAAGRLRADDPAVRALVASLCEWTRSMMRDGAPIALALPGRVGWELRLVVQGGLRILEKIAAMDHASFARRPRLRAADHLRVGLRALAMRPALPSPAQAA